MRTKRGQAAMEFLMTYGWAILAAVIVIGVLASFGVFSSSNYIPTSCSLTAPFGCDKNQVTASEGGNTLTLVIRNGGGQNYIMQGANLTGCTASSVTLGGFAITGTTLADQDPQSLIFTCAGGELVADEKFTGDITLLYRPVGGTIDLSASGSVTVKVGA